MLFGEFDGIDEPDPKEGLDINEFCNALEEKFGFEDPCSDGAASRLFCEIDKNGNKIISEKDLFIAIKEL